MQSLDGGCVQAGGLQDGSGGRPVYTLRTLGRALEYARACASTYGLQRALYDGAAMAFQTQLQPASMPVMEALLCQHLLGTPSMPKVGAGCLAVLMIGVAFPLLVSLPSVFD